MCQVCNKANSVVFRTKKLCGECMTTVYPRTAASIPAYQRIRFEYDYDSARADTF